MTYLKARRTALRLRVKKEASRLIGRTKGSISTKLHTVTDRNGHPLDVFMATGQISDYMGATAFPR